MQLTYIFHSSFLLETEKCILVFDFWMDPARVVEQYLDSGKRMYVFSSHFHEDHFNRDIFSWRIDGRDIVYILSKDILKRRRAQKDEADVWLAKGGEWHDDMISVTATGSTDSGVSWIVTVGNSTVFHAGDLNNWYARFLTDDYHGGAIYSEEFQCEVNPEKEEKLFLGELKDILKFSDRFDVVMYPIDGRIGNGYTRGGRQFIDRFNVGLFVPMHFVASGYESAWRMQEFAEEKGIRFWKIGEVGETIEL